MQLNKLLLFTGSSTKMSANGRTIINARRIASTREKSFVIDFTIRDFSNPVLNFLQYTTRKKNLSLKKLPFAEDIIFSSTIKSLVGRNSASNTYIFKVYYSLSNTGADSQHISYKIVIKPQISSDASEELLIYSKNNVLVKGLCSVQGETPELDLTSFINEREDGLQLYFEEISCKNVPVVESRMLESQRSMFEEDCYKDIQFLIDGESVKAHRIIITARCSVMKAMLTHDTKENQDGIVEITDSEMPAFKTFLKYLYTDEIENIEVYAEKLIALADKYDMQCLKNKCQHFLCQTVDKKTAISHLILAEMHNCEFLKEEAMSIIGKNIKEIWHSQDLIQLRESPSSCSLYEEIIGTILSYYKSHIFAKESIF